MGYCRVCKQVQESAFDSTASASATPATRVTEQAKPRSALCAMERGWTPMSLDLENRPEHIYRMSHVLVFGHGLADTTDARLAAALAKAELERLGVL